MTKHKISRIKLSYCQIWLGNIINAKCIPDSQPSLNKQSKAWILWVVRGNTPLAGVAQWIECWPASQKALGSILGQGTCLCCGPGPQFGGMGEATDWCFFSCQCFSPSFSPCPPLSLKINKSLKKRVNTQLNGFLVNSIIWDWYEILRNAVP